MHKILTLSVILLALGALVAAPGIAADVGMEAEADADRQLDLEELIDDEVLESPAGAATFDRCTTRIDTCSVEQTNECPDECTCILLDCQVVCHGDVPGCQPLY